MIFVSLTYMIEFILEGEFIPLIQLLKATDLVSSGGEAQMVVVDGLVKYNGSVDYRKRLKVRKGDIIEFKSQKIKVI
jgi:ribosome-associated protein